MEIQTRENGEGKWWCNGTITGYGDVSFEGETIADAQLKMDQFLYSKLINGDECEWLQPVKYVRTAPKHSQKTTLLSALFSLGIIK